MSIPERVLRLEDLDTEIEGTEAALHDIRRRIERNPTLEAADARVSRLRENERAAAVHQRALESELGELEAKIKRDNARMYGGQIVDARELSSLERELEHYALRRDDVESRLLEAMEHADAFREEIAASEAQAGESRTTWDAERPDLEEQERSLRDRLSMLRSERETAAHELDARTLAAYTRLHTGSGHAVSRVRNRVCQWCRVTIPPKDVQHARSGALVSCTNCGRILHVAD